MQECIRLRSNAKLALLLQMVSTVVCQSRDAPSAATAWNGRLPDGVDMACTGTEDVSRACLVSHLYYDTSTRTFRFHGSSINSPQTLTEQQLQSVFEDETCASLSSCNGLVLVRLAHAMTVFASWGGHAQPVVSVCLQELTR
jgi:hypothetical protein